MNITQSPSRGNVPPEYRRWLAWEVCVPIGAPMVVLGMLTLIFFNNDRTLVQSAFNAMVAVAGTGDLLIFGGLLLLNVSGTLSLEGHGRKDLITDDNAAHATLTLVVGMFTLLIYGMIRLYCHMPLVGASAGFQFWFGMVSLVWLLGTLIWADHVLRAMHLRRIHFEYNHGKIRGQYNVD